MMSIGRKILTKVKNELSKIERYTRRERKKFEYFCVCNYRINIIREVLEYFDDDYDTVLLQVRSETVQ